MHVRDYMTPEVVTANLRDGLRQTWERMHERNVRHMPVLDDGGKLVGMITDRDLRRPGVLDTENVTHYFALDNHTLVEQAMTSPPLTVEADDGIGRALDLFVDRKVGAVPVVDPGGALVGMLSAIDVLRAVRARGVL